MTDLSKKEYHLAELETALDPSDPRYAMPDVHPNDTTILDIGCGMGQTLVALELNENQFAIGVDIDQESMEAGSKEFDGIRYAQCTAEALPFANDTFDLVYSRVAVPYTNVPETVDEIYRVLQPGGRVWMTLHPLRMTLRQLGNSIKQFKFKDIVFRNYVLLNGACFHLFGKLFPFPAVGRIESFQSNKSIRACLKKRGFSNISISRDGHFFVTAEKPGK